MGVPGSGQHGRVYVLSCTLCVCVSRELLRVGDDQGAKRERGSRSGKRGTGSKQNRDTRWISAGGFEYVLTLDSFKREHRHALLDVLFCVFLDYNNKTLHVLGNKTLTLTKCFVFYGWPWWGRFSGFESLCTPTIHQKKIVMINQNNIR
jgi:hypothetical protein